MKLNMRVECGRVRTIGGLGFMTWIRALKTLRRSQQKAVNEVFHWCEERGAFGGHVLRNLKNDRFLRLSVAKKLVDLFLRLDPRTDIKAFQSEFFKICRNNVLNGGEIKLRPNPPRIGRAADYDSHVAAISRINGRPLSMVERLLMKLEASSLISSERAELARMAMSGYAVWITWDRDTNGNASPFAFLKDDCAYDLRRALGLEISSSAIANRRVITYTYSSGDVRKLIRPTVADAGTHLRFQPREGPPPKEADWYGLTLPWPDDPLGKHSDEDGTYPPKCPEALHERINFPLSLTCQILDSKAPHP